MASVLTQYLLQISAVRRTVCDVEVVAHRQAPHSASDTGGDALPPQVPHPSGRAPAGGGSASQKLVFPKSLSRARTSDAEETFSAKRKSVRVNSNQPAGIQHV